METKFQKILCTIMLLFGIIICNGKVMLKNYESSSYKMRVFI
jgi:hypothetical protein